MVAEEQDKGKERKSEGSGIRGEGCAPMHPEMALKPGF